MTLLLTPVNAEAESHSQAVTILTRDVMRNLDTSLLVGTVTARMHRIYGELYGRSNINWWRMRLLPVDQFERLVYKAVADLVLC